MVKGGWGPVREVGGDALASGGAVGQWNDDAAGVAGVGMDDLDHLSPPARRSRRRWGSQ